MDKRLRNLWRNYSQDPIPENRQTLQHYLRKMGSPLGNQLVFEVHEAANRVRAGSQLPLGLTSRLAIAHRDYRLDRLLAGAVYAGLEREDLQLLLDSLQMIEPVAVYSPSGFALQEIVANWLECDSMYGPYEDYYLVGELGEEQHVTRLMHFCPNFDNTLSPPEIRMGYVGTDGDIKTDQALVNYMQQNYDSELEIEEIIQSAEGESLGMIASDYARALPVEVETVITTLSEFKRHFVLWLAMESRGWLG